MKEIYSNKGFRKLLKQNKTLNYDRNLGRNGLTSPEKPEKKQKNDHQRVGSEFKKLKQYLVICSFILIFAT